MSSEIHARDRYHPLPFPLSPVGAFCFPSWHNAHPLLIDTPLRNIGGLGELVRLVRPPVTGRSASFRLRFRFVRAVRAVRGEAKLRGRT
jgi:hypothetical protein